MKECASVDEFFDNPVFRFNKFYLEIIGRWPYQSIEKRYFFTLLIVLGIFTVFIPEVYFLIIFQVAPYFKFYIYFNSFNSIH